MKQWPDGYDFCWQDSNYPWNQRVSFASDIAAGMVSSETKMCLYSV